MKFVAEAVAVHGLDLDGMTIEREQVTTSAGSVSALRYGRAGRDTPPALAFLHGGGQNSHTWDLTMAALAVPALALDLPGHGDSDWLPDHDYSPRRLTAAVGEALVQLGPDTEVLVGMSLGGMVALTVAPLLPKLRALVLVDVSPGSTMPPDFSAAHLQREHGSPFDSLVEQMKKVSPQRPWGALRHAVWHATRQSAEGREWRTDPQMRVGSFLDLWSDVLDHASVVTAVLATMGSFVSDEDRARLREVLEDRVQVVEGAAHSVQNTRPRELAAILRVVLEG